MKRLMLATAVLAAVNAFAATRAVTPTAWNGDPNCWQMKRHNEKMQTVKQGGAKVVFIGDSITHFWESNGKEQLKKYYSEGDLKMLNLGVSGDRTEHVLWRLQQGGELDGYEAKCVLLMIGTNNTGHRHLFPELKRETPADTILGIREIVKTIRAKQPKAKVVLTAIFPFGEKPEADTRLRNDVINREICKFADGENVFWCDLADDFLNADAVLPKATFPDFLHPNAAGYEIWHKGVQPYIDYALSDGKLPAPKNRFAKTLPKLDPNLPAPARPVTRIGEGNAKRHRQSWWDDRLLQKRNQIFDSNGEIDLVFFGDSITHGWEGRGKDSLAALRKTYSILDIGYGGDRTQHLVWRGLNGELDGYKAKCIMLMIGTNNREKPEEIAAGIKRILEIIAQKQPQAKTLLLPIFPRGANSKDANRIRNQKVNALIKPYADGDKVIWVDFNKKFLDKQGDTKWCMADRLHPGAEGYKNIWVPSVLPYFEKITGKKAIGFQPYETVNVPELMKTAKGEPVTTVEQWEKVRRPELLETFLTEVYGKRPVEKPDTLKFELAEPDKVMMDGKAIRKRVRASWQGPLKSQSFVFTAFIPVTAKVKPAPGFILICNRPPADNIDPERIKKIDFWPAEEIVARGYSAITFYNGDVAPDKSLDEFVEGVQTCWSAKRTDDSWGTLSAWAWGASRVLDWIETEPLLDAKHIGVVGHSRGGKTALLAGVTDTRFAMACSNDSGCGGAKLYHMNNPGSEPIEAIVRHFKHWFCRNYMKKYPNKDLETPFDQHQWVALMAPRAVAIASASEDKWAGPRGEQMSGILASPAWELYGKKGLVQNGFPKPNEAQQEGMISYHLREGKHNLTLHDWNRYMDFADRLGWKK